jgi:hypothetical protein
MSIEEMASIFNILSKGSWNKHSDTLTWDSGAWEGIVEFGARRCGRRVLAAEIFNRAVRSVCAGLGTVEILLRHLESSGLVDGDYL